MHSNFFYIVCLENQVFNCYIRKGHNGQWTRIKFCSESSTMLETDLIWCLCLLSVAKRECSLFGFTILVVKIFSKVTQKCTFYLCKWGLQVRPYSPVILNDEELHPVDMGDTEIFFVMRKYIVRARTKEERGLQTGLNIPWLGTLECFPHVLKHKSNYSGYVCEN